MAALNRLAVFLLRVITFVTGLFASKPGLYTARLANQRELSSLAKGAIGERALLLGLSRLRQLSSVCRFLREVRLSNLLVVARTRRKFASCLTALLLAPFSRGQRH